ncbi:MAG: YggS family pyridoxal phosphate-dependent enzyme [Selenomonadaceae bacterium]|jgi:pyridoxal phosphate enzyme, YggS family
MIKENLKQVQQIIREGIARRSPSVCQDNVKLIAVTKNHDVEAMREAIDAGAVCIGENRVQEALSKYDCLGRSVEWHLIGHLQTNKVKYAVELFDLIHSVDSLKLAVELDKAARKIGKVQDVLLQVNLAKEESKSGIYREELPEVLQSAAVLENIHICGLMCIAPNYDDSEQARPLFREMYQLFQEVRQMGLKAADIRFLSMGMSHDYKVAVEEGANIVRVGTAIFGQRQY